jgi:glutamate racemase
MIGVFDSGAGGLTVVRALRKLAPKLDIIYLADTTNMPYGDRSDDEIRQLTVRAFELLRARGATTIVSACNSVSASVIRPMMEFLDVREARVIEMVGSAIDELESQGIVQAICLATPATVRSGMYVGLAAAKGIELTCLACPTLAGLIESNAPLKILYATVDALMRNFPEDAHAVLLGCTHYPLILDIFEETARLQGQSFKFVDPADAVAAATIRQVGATGSGRLLMMCTGEPMSLEHHVVASLRTEIEIERVRLPVTRQGSLCKSRYIS